MAIALAAGCREILPPAYSAALASPAAARPESGGKRAQTGRASDTQNAVPEARNQEDGQKDVDPRKWLASLKPVANGFGLVVCEPVVKNADSTTAQFGSGCARWLHFTIGGHAELGKTPTWESVERARKELGAADLRLSRDQALKLQGKLGITHVATGTISGNAIHCTLTYQLWQTATGHAIGGPLSATGTPPQVVAALPGLTRALLTRLKVSPTHVPSAVGADPADLQRIGQIAWAPPDRDTFPPESQQEAQLQAAARRFPLAGMLSLAWGADRDPERMRAAAQTLVRQAPDNPLVYAWIGYQLSGNLEPFADRVARLSARYPHSYLCALARVRLLQERQDLMEAASASEPLVRLAPSNPDAWLTLGAAISDVGEHLRRGRVVEDITKQEWKSLDTIYSRWLLAVLEAAQRDPQYGKAWLRVATAATFAGAQNLADKAFWRAEALENANMEVFYWGLQMYQPKWFDDPKKLARVAQIAAVAPYKRLVEGEAITDTLYAAGFKAETTRLLNRLLARGREAVQRNPQDISAHDQLGHIFEKLQKRDDAAREYETVLRLAPDSYVAHYELASVRFGCNDMEGAIREYWEAIRLHPDYQAAHRWLGRALYNKQKFDEAEGELREAIRLNDEDALAHRFLAQALVGKSQNKQAIAEYERAIALHPSDSNAYEAVCWLLEFDGQDEAAFQAAARAVALEPDDISSHECLAHIYQKKNQLEEAIQEWRTCVHLAPNEWPLHNNLASALIAAGRKEEARAEWQQVLKLAPNNDLDSDRKQAKQMLEKYR